MQWLDFAAAGLAPFIWHIASSLTLIALCLVGAWFLAPFRKWFILLAIWIASILVGYIIGAKNATARCDAQQAIVQSSVDNAVRDAVASPGPVQHDPWDGAYKNPKSGLFRSHRANPL